MKIVDPSYFENKSPEVKRIYELRYNEDGTVKHSINEISAIISREDKRDFSRSAVSGVFHRNREIFTNGKKISQVMTPVAIKQRQLRERQKREKEQLTEQLAAIKSKVTEGQDEVSEKKETPTEPENELYMDATNGKNPPKKWKRAKLDREVNQKDYLAGERLAGEFLNSEEGWQEGKNGIVGKPLLHIGLRECRYVVDDTEGMMLMCGKKTDSYPYCSEHNRFTFTKSTRHVEF